MIVRLKVVAAFKISSELCGFNSMIVRLKGYTNMSNKTNTGVFQFYDSPIKSVKPDRVNALILLVSIL